MMRIAIRRGCNRLWIPIIGDRNQIEKCQNDKIPPLYAGCMDVDTGGVANMPLPGG